MAQSAHVKLAAHSGNPARFHQCIDVTLTRQPNGGLTLRYAIHGLNLDLRIPTSHQPAPADALWQTSCCELFLAPISARGQTSYREFNFSPSGQSACYAFADTRQSVPHTTPVPPPQIECQRSEALIEVTASLPPAALPPGGDTMRIAVSVILEAEGGHHGYWALAHPPGSPDFHHHAGFLLTLGPAGFRPAQWL